MRLLSIEYKLRISMSITCFWIKNLSKQQQVEISNVALGLNPSFKEYYVIFVNFLVKKGAIYYIKLLSLFKLPYILAYNALFGNKKTDKNLMTLDSLEMHITCWL